MLCAIRADYLTITDDGAVFRKFFAAYRAGNVIAFFLNNLGNIVIYKLE